MTLGLRANGGSARRIHAIVTCGGEVAAHALGMVLLMCVDLACGGLAVSPERFGAVEQDDAREACCSACGRTWSLPGYQKDDPLVF